MSMVTDVIAKIRTYFPSGGERYSDSFITALTHAADCVIKEECESLWSDGEITLYPGVLYYDIPENAIAVRNVRFSKDGTTFNDGVLSGTSYDDLDRFDMRWKERRGVEPSHYMLVSAPGVPQDTGPSENGYSKILIWRPLSTTVSQKIKFEYLKYYEGQTLEFVVQSERAEVVDLVYVPYVMAAIYASVNIQMFVEWWRKYREGIPRARAIYMSKYAEGSGNFRAGGPTIDGGQL